MSNVGLGKLAALAGYGAPRRIDPRFYMAARCAVYMGLGMLMSCARVLSGGAPFGMAMVACSGAGLSGVCALCGASLGYVLGGGIEWGIRYVAASVLVYTISFIFQEVSIYKSDYFMPCAAGFVSALTGFLGSFYDTVAAIELYGALILESSLAFGGAYFFREALSNTLCTTQIQELRHSTSALIMVACALISFARVTVFTDVSVGRVAAMIAVMASAMKGGMLTGAAVGTVLGLAMDLSHVSGAYYTMAYAFAGLLSGVFGKHGRVIFTLSFLLASALASLCECEEGVLFAAMFETGCAALVFMLLPGAWVTQLALMRQYADRGRGESSLRQFVAGRVMNLSEAYAELYETVRKNVEEPYNDENIARVFDRAADEVCVKCRYKNRCWNTEYMDTLSAMNDATEAMTEHGTLTSADLPGYFRERCDGLPAFIAAVNGELRSLSYRRELRVHLKENRNVAWTLYSDVSGVLHRVAGELGSLNGSDPAAERRLVRYLQSLDIDADAAVYRDASGRVRVMIESGRLAPLTKHPGYLEKLSAVVGVRLCLASEEEETSSRLTLLEAEPLAVSVGIAALKKRGEKVSGDKGTYFKTDEGVLCVILSDGMGTGDEAARGSGEVVAILEKFLRSGVEPATAMKILNSVMLLRGQDSWGYATVDLMCVDLFTGDTGFYKYGAAPSYVCSSRGVYRVKGETLAAGLSMGEGSAPDIVRMRLKPGCTAVIASDGVIADAQDEWLKALLNRGFDDMKALARSTLKEAEKHYGANDDMTVVTVRVEERA